MIAIYKITNQLNGKPYIGQTRQPLEKRLYQHRYANSPLSKDMQEYGAENFTIELVEECETQEQANQQERFHIKELGCKVPNGYNQSDGGEHGEVYFRVVKTKSTCPPHVEQPAVEKSALDLFVEENNLAEADKIFLENFAHLQPATRAVIREVAMAFAFRDAWRNILQLSPQPHMAGQAGMTGAIAQ